MATLTNMTKSTHKFISNLFRQITSGCIVGAMILQSVFTAGPVFAQETQTVLDLPVPGTRVAVSEKYTPVMMKGLKLHQDNPLAFDFIIHPGDEAADPVLLEQQSQPLIKYFMAALTVPEDKLWVNLSPYEENRIIADEFARTEMGRDLLAQDYMLKQLTASMMYPEEDLGEEFWSRVYRVAQERFGTTDIPVNTFNKIWIVPERAVVHQNDLSVYVVDTHLKVLLEEDYLALEHHTGIRDTAKAQTEDEIITGVSTQIVREVLIPEIEREVNEGRTFANLRQIYNSLILAVWYKQNLKNSFLAKVYSDQSKVRGIEVEDREIHQKIYKQYVKAFEEGVYNYIKEEYDPQLQETIPRKYFSGGVDYAQIAERMDANESRPSASDLEGAFRVQVNLNGLTRSGNVVTSQEMFADSAMMSDRRDRNTRLRAGIQQMGEEFSTMYDRQAFDLPTLDEMGQFGIAMAEMFGVGNITEMKGERQRKAGGYDKGYVLIRERDAENPDRIVEENNPGRLLRDNTLQPRIDKGSVFAERGDYKQVTGEEFYQALVAKVKEEFDDMVLESGRVIGGEQQRLGRLLTVITNYLEAVVTLQRLGQDRLREYGNYEADAGRSFRSLDEGVQSIAQWLAAEVNQADRDQPIVIVLHGAPGSGKSTLTDIVINGLVQQGHVLGDVLDRTGLADRKLIHYYDESTEIGIDRGEKWRNDFYGHKGVVVVETVQDEVPEEWHDRENLLFIHVQAQREIRETRLQQREQSSMARWMLDQDAYYDYNALELTDIRNRFSVQNDENIPNLDFLAEQKFLFAFDNAMLAEVRQANRTADEDFRSERLNPRTDQRTLDEVLDLFKESYPTKNPTAEDVQDLLSDTRNINIVLRSQGDRSVAGIVSATRMDADVIQSEFIDQGLPAPDVPLAETIFAFNQAVRPELRGQGLGTALYRELARQAAETLGARYIVAVYKDVAYARSLGRRSRVLGIVNQYDGESGAFALVQTEIAPEGDRRADSAMLGSTQFVVAPSTDIIDELSDIGNRPVIFSENGRLSIIRLEGAEIGQRDITRLEIYGLLQSGQTPLVIGQTSEDVDFYLSTVVPEEVTVRLTREGIFVNGVRQGNLQVTHDVGHIAYGMTRNPTSGERQQSRVMDVIVYQTLVNPRYSAERFRKELALEEIPVRKIENYFIQRNTDEAAAREKLYANLDQFLNLSGWQREQFDQLVETAIDLDRQLETNGFIEFQHRIGSPIRHQDIVVVRSQQSADTDLVDQAMLGTDADFGSENWQVGDIIREIQSDRLWTVELLSTERTVSGIVLDTISLRSADGFSRTLALSEVDRSYSHERRVIESASDFETIYQNPANNGVAFDITSRLFTVHMRDFTINTNFRLPNGEAWDREEPLSFATDRLQRLILKPYFNRNGEIDGIELEGYDAVDAEARQLKSIGSQFFRWNGETFLPATLESEVSRLYASAEAAAGIEYDLTKLIAPRFLRRAEIPSKLPLPNGSILDTEDIGLRMGYRDLSRLTLRVEHDAQGQVDRLTFTGYRVEDGREVRVRSSQWLWRNEQLEFVDPVGVVSQAYQSGSTAATDISNVLGYRGLRDANLPGFFTLPDGNTIGEGERASLRLGVRNLSRAEMIVIYDGSDVSGLRFIGFRENEDGEYQAGYSEFAWDGQQLSFVRNSREDKLEAIRQMYAGETAAGKLLDISDFLGDRNLARGELNQGFVFPDGSTLDQLSVLGIGRNLSRVEMAVRNIDGESAVEFVGYRVTDGVEREAGRNIWTLNDGQYQRTDLVRSTREATIRHLSNPDMDGETIDITNIFTQRHLDKGLFPVSFPSPDGDNWVQGQTRMRLGSRLERVELTPTYQDGKVVSIRLQALRRNYFDETKLETVSSDWISYRGQLVLSRNDQAIWQSYEKAPGAESTTVDITDYLSASALKAGQIPTTFPLPNGQTWGFTDFMRVGKELGRVEMAVSYADSGEVSTITFTGYSADQRGRLRQTNQSEWDWNGRRFVFRAKLDADAGAIRDMYGDSQGKRFRSVDISSILGKAGLNKGRVVSTFPLPNGEMWGSKNIQSLRIGDGGFSQVKMRINYSDTGEVEGVTFTSYKLNGNRNVKHRSSSWSWDGTQFIFQPSKDEDRMDVIRDRIVRSYSDRRYGGRLVDISKFVGDTGMKNGRLGRSFPLPNGQRLGKVMTLRLGSRTVNLSSLKMRTDYNSAGEISQLVFFAYTDREDGGIPQLTTTYWNYVDGGLEFDRVERNDQAMLGESETPGGIDLNPNNFTIEAQGEINLPAFDLTPQQIETMDLDGFVPVIINIAPINNIPLLLGTDDSNAEDETVSFQQVRLKTPAQE